jgi:DnaK suppressor protein
VDGQQAEQLLTAQRDAAQSRAASMTAELAQLAAASADSNLDDEHDPEGSTIAFERAQLSALLGQARSQLEAIDAAFVRLAAGEYGYCEECGEAIVDARLSAVPLARRCIRCAS